MMRRNERTKTNRLQKSNVKPASITAKRQTGVRQRNLTAALAEKIKGKLRRIRQIVSGKKLTVIRGPKKVESSWVDSIAYVRYGSRNGVAVKFLGGAEVFYPNTTVKDYEYLRDAASKGKSIHRRFYDLNYELL